VNTQLITFKLGLDDDIQRSSAKEVSKQMLAIKDTEKIVSEHLQSKGAVPESILKMIGEVYETITLESDKLAIKFEKQIAEYVHNS
jgi:hypothetical protein